MIVSNVDIGSGPGVGDGDSLYTAFDKVNHNFANVLSNVNNLTNSVSTVAGRTGNVVLTVNDIIGLSNAYAIASSTATANTAMRGYVVNQWPTENNQRLAYRPEQMELLNNLQNYMATPPSRKELIQQQIDKIE